MKSAYELAMERLDKSDPSSKHTLNDDQKARLAEIDLVFQGKLAEREIFLLQKLDSSLASGNAEEADQMRGQISSEKARLEEEREADKDRVREES